MAALPGHQHLTLTQENPGGRHHLPASAIEDGCAEGVKRRA
jgi:hypothetical protein